MTLQAHFIQPFFGHAVSITKLNHRVEEQTEAPIEGKRSPVVSKMDRPDGHAA